MSKLQTSLRRRWEQKVNKTKSCWLWTAGTARGGYGELLIETTDGKRRMGLAHRISWLLFRGSIPKGIYVLHKCDTPRCVNPSHLFLGTQKDNARDAMRKGRLDLSGLMYSRGKGKLSEDDVRTIRATYRREAHMISNTRALAKKYGVNPNTITAIACRGERSSVK